MAVDEAESRGSRHGRRFVQQGAHHLLRDIRHRMKAEIAELRESNVPVEEAAVIPEPGGIKPPELDEALPAGALLDLSV